MAMSNNFKDDFEKNRQSIDTNSHQDHTEDVEKDQSELEHQDTIENTEQQFPPRNAQRRKRRRDLATNHNKQVHNESQTSEDNVQNEAGTIDDRQVESSHSTESQEPSHQDSTPQHEEEYYNKNAFAMDKSHPEPIEDNDKHETIKEAENNTEHSTVSDKSEAEQSQQPKPYFATGANQANTSKDKHDDVTVKQDKDESKDHHSGKKAQQLVLEQRVLQVQLVQWVFLKLRNIQMTLKTKVILTSRITRLRIKRLKISLKIIIMAKKVQRSVLEQQVWLEAQQVKVLLPLQNHMPLIMQAKTMMNMTIMTEIKNVKRWHGQSIVTINCSCTNYRCISDIWRHGIKQS